MNANTLWGLLRLSMGWIFLWPFLDKLMGLGFSTCRDVETGVVTMMCEKAWLAGGSPTMGFLKFGTKGPFAEMFQALAGNPIVDWLFMLGLLGIGIALLLGVMTRLAVWSGVAMLVLMYVAGFMPPEHNPFLDDHLIYAVLLLALGASGAQNYLGYGKQWAKSDIAKKYPILR